MEQRIGINGFGRIGRAIFRLLLEKEGMDAVVINDINQDKNNLAYLLKYDSLHGTLKQKVSSDKEGIVVDGKKVFIYHEKHIDKVPWHEHKVSIVMDATGVHDNVVKARDLKGKVQRVIVTHSPAEELLDRSVIIGINEKDIKAEDFVISSSICDANAFGPVIHALERQYGVDHGAITTLHPWLQYQNLLDGPSMSFAYPGHVYSEYVLGRASTMSLLPKPTTTVSATCKVLKHLSGKFYAFSYRVPTAAVSSSDLTVKLKKKTTVEEVKCLFEAEEKKQRFKVFHNNFEPLVSIDFKGMEYSVIIDHRWTAVMDGNYVKLILWYDNEWGYAARVIDLAHCLLDQK